MELHICSTNLQLFQSVLIRGSKNPNVIYLLDKKRLEKSPYLFLLDKYKLVDFSRFSFYAYESNLMFKISKIISDYQKLISYYGDFKSIYLSNPIDPIATISYNFHKKKAEIFFFDDGLFSAKKTKEYFNFLPRLKLSLKHFIKNIFRYWIYYKNDYELLWSKHPHSYIKNEDKNHIVMVRGYEGDRDNNLYLEDIVFSKDIERIVKKFNFDKNKKYHFLSFNDKPDNIVFHKDIIYVGHPKIEYGEVPVIKNIPSELIVLTQEVEIGLSSLQIVKELGSRIR